MLVLFLLGCKQEFDVVAEGLGPALLSITGTTADDVWTVGADAGDGPLVAHWDGAAWSTVDTGTEGDLWWVFQDGDALWMVGAGGRVLRHDVEAGTTDEEVLSESFTLFGVWGDGAGTVHAVGGDLDAGTPALLKWTEDLGWLAPPTPAEVTQPLYKVWGFAPDDVWACGAGGALIHWDGALWTSVTSPTTRTLFTVHGASNGQAWAVGGFGTAAIARFDGDSWSDESPQAAPQLNGVFARGQDVVAAGAQGAIWWRQDGAWAADEREPAVVQDFHAAWLDPDGGVWAVGGSIASAPLDQGVLVYGGDSPPETFEP